MSTPHRLHRTRRLRPRRRGNILILSAIMMVMVAAFVAFAVDLGSLYVARCELQRCADSAAMAAAWDLIDESALTDSSNYLTLKSTSQSRAAEYALFNKVLSAAPTLPAADVEVGVLTDPTDPNGAIDLASTSAPNAVRVTVRRTSAQNGAIAFSFAKVLGVFSQDLTAQATAAMITNFEGFRTPGDGGNLGILPIALDDTTWTALLAGTGSDDYTWNEATGTVTAGSDGIKEVNLYPEGNGSPGNRGTVDIGSNNNSTEVLSRQIVDGITPDDLDHHGGELKFNENGELSLNGDTGISAGIKDDLISILGEPRIIPVFTEVNSPGNNANYTITKFVSVRVLEVKLTGSNSSKKVTVQPCTMVARGAIPSTTAGKSYYMYSPVWLVK
jgi:Flp pilus assembly protein TadG